MTQLVWDEKESGILTSFGRLLLMLVPGPEVEIALGMAQRPPHLERHLISMLSEVSIQTFMSLSQDS